MKDERMKKVVKIIHDEVEEQIEKNKRKQNSLKI